MTDTALSRIMPIPPPEPDRPPSSGIGDWLRRNLFRSPVDGVVSVVAGVILGYVVYRLARFVGVTGRWEIVKVNLKLFMVGRYPVDELWRLTTALALIALFGGLVVGFVAARRRAMGREEIAPAVAWWRRGLALLGRVWPLVVGVAVLLSLTTTTGPWLTVAITLAAALVGRLLGSHLPRRSALPLVLVAVLGFGGLVAFLANPSPWDEWGGLMLNVFLAVAGITLCFPLGVLLALGRRSKLPLIRWLSIGYIELFRGVPLYVLLLLSNIALGLFWVPNEAPDLVVRSIVAMALFTAAYVAEIVRGGLQSLPRGQTEASYALGMSPVRTTLLIVLPQALRNVIPALVGQFISLFKDTTLAAAAMGFLDLLNVQEAVTAQTVFAGQRLVPEVLAFVMFVFWVGCITMSRESQRLERRLGVGTR